MLTLRPYQEASIDSLRAGFRSGHVRQVLASATGSGKSVIMVSMIESALAKGSRVMFICERRILVEQFSRHLDSIHIDHGVLMAKHWRFRPHALVQVASAQTLERMESWPAFDVVFIDELHACMRKSVVRMIENRPSMRIIGATATPFHPAIGKYFTSVTNPITMKELVDNNSLVPFKVFVAKEIDTNGVKVTAGEWQKDELERRGQQIVGDIVTDFIQISNRVFGGYRKTICFSCGVAHGTDLVQRFSSVGINAVQLTYRDTEEFKADVLADFAKEDTQIQVLISADILTRGYDQTDVEYVILARPLKKSFSSHVQMVGRGARPHPGKKFCVIQDNAGNWLRFQESWDELFNDGISELTSGPDEKTRKEPTDKEKEASKCPVCGSLWPGKSDVCLHCGHVRVRRNDVIDVNGVMVEIGSETAKEAYPVEMKQAFYQQLIGYAESKGYKPGWVFYAYQDKFGVEPSTRFDRTPEQPSLEVLRFIQHRNIKKAKAKK